MPLLRGLKTGLEERPQKLTAQHQNDHCDQENEADRAAAQVVDIGENRRE